MCEMCDNYAPDDPGDADASDSLDRIDRALLLRDYLDDPAVLCLIPQPIRDRISSIMRSPCECIECDGEPVDRWPCQIHGVANSPIAEDKAVRDAAYEGASDSRREWLDRLYGFAPRFPEWW